MMTASCCNNYAPMFQAVNGHVLRMCESCAGGIIQEPRRLHHVALTPSRLHGPPLPAGGGGKKEEVGTPTFESLRE